jgi:hypothetical protein
MLSALIERRHKWPIRFFHTFGGSGLSAVRWAQQQAVSEVLGLKSFDHSDGTQTF